MRAWLLLPPDTRAYVYTKCRGPEHWVQPCTGLLQPESEIPTWWFLTVPTAVEVLLEVCATTTASWSVFPRIGWECHSTEKGTERQALLTWSCPHFHCRVWQAESAHPKLKPGARSSRAVWAQNQTERFWMLCRCGWTATHVRTQVTAEHSYRLWRSQMGIQPCYSRLIHRLNHWHCLPTAHLLEWHFAHRRGDMPGFIWSRCLLTMGLESSLLKTATDTSFSIGYFWRGNTCWQQVQRA